MRLRSILLLLLPLAACEPSLESGPRVDLISSSRFTTVDQRLTVPADTVTTKVYAAQEDDSAPLTNLRIELNYSPQPTPFIYDALYDPEKPGVTTLVYLDSTFTRSDFAFTSVHSARTTAGLETWSYTFTDANKKQGSRSIKARLTRVDSLSLYHSYSVVLQAPATVDNSRRSFLALREGLAMPKFMVRTNAENQALVDLIYYPGSASSGPVLATPADPGLTLSSRWVPRRATQLRLTSLNNAAFQALTTPTLITAAFAGASPTVTRTPPVELNTVVAFQTPENKTGLFRVAAINTTGIPSISLQVIVTK